MGVEPRDLLIRDTAVVARQLESQSSSAESIEILEFAGPNDCTTAHEGLLLLQLPFLRDGLCTFPEPQELLLLTVNWNYTF